MTTTKRPVPEIANSYDGWGELPTLYAKTATGAIQEWTCWASEEQVYVRWGQQGGAMQEARFECYAKNRGRANEVTAEKQAIKEAIAKWNKQVKKKYHWDLAVIQDDSARKKLSNARKPMLAKKYEDHKDKLVFPVIVQPKYDGLRCFAFKHNGEVVLQSRGGDPYDVAHIRAEFERIFKYCNEEVVFDGELYLHRTSLQALNSLVRRPQRDSRELQYWCYDAFFPARPELIYDRRYAEIVNIFGYVSNSSLEEMSVKRAPNNRALDHDEVMAMHAKLVMRGFEGAIVRSILGVYRMGYRSPDLLKVKAWQDAEFEIVGHKVGKGKFANVPIFRCVTPDGKGFDVAPRGTELERNEMLKQAPALKGKLMKVQFFDYTDDGVPHFPVGLGIRDSSDL